MSENKMSQLPFNISGGAGQSYPAFLETEEKWQPKEQKYYHYACNISSHLRDDGEIDSS